MKERWHFYRSLGYDNNVNLDNIQSPLPPRKVEVGVNNENLAMSSANSQDQAPPPQTPEPKRSIDIKKFLPILGIIIIIPLIYLVITKLIIPGVSGKPGKDVTLTYWGLWEDSSVLQSLIDEFEANNPGIKVNYIQNQKINYRTRLAGRLEKSGDEASEVPDIFRIHSSWVPMFKSNLANVPSNIATEIKLEEDFYDAYKTDLKQGSSYVGIPLMYDQLALFYNKELLEAAQKNPPKTWWGLRETAKQLTVRDENGDIKVAGVAMGAIENVDHWNDIIGLMLKQNSVDITKKDEANSKKLEGVLTFYTLFNTSDKVWSESLAASTVQFANGKLAFYFAPSWRVFNLDDMNKDLKFEVTAVPQLPTLEGLDPSKVESGEVEGQLTSDQWSTYWFEGVNKDSKNQDAAWKFLKFMASKESLEKFYTAASQVRRFGEIYPRKSMSEGLMGNSKIKPFIVTANQGSSWYMSSRTFDEGINDDLGKYFGDAVNTIIHNTNQSVGEVITPLQNGITQVVNKYKITKKISE